MSTPIKLFYLALKVAMLGIIAFILVVSLPFNPVNEQLGDGVFVRSFVPEGWAFFTRNPREEKLEIYYRINGQWVQNPLAPMGKASNMFGLWRKIRAQSVEVAMLLPQVQPQKWLVGKKGFHLPVIDSATTIRVTNPSPLAVLPDTIAVVKHLPVPWSYARFITPDSLPCRYVVLNVKRTTVALR